MDMKPVGDVSGRDVSTAHMHEGSAEVLQRDARYPFSIVDLVTVEGGSNLDVFWLLQLIEMRFIKRRRSVARGVKFPANKESRSTPSSSTRINTVKHNHY